MKTYYFMAGLPRSGSTLISSILNQNPNIYASSNSPMCGMMYNLEKNILNSEQYLAYPKPQVISNTVMGVLDGYYSDINQNIVIDKCRDWMLPEPLEMLQRNLRNDIKIIISVRDILDILASFMSLIYKNQDKINFIDFEIEQNNEFNFYREKNDIRCDHLMKPRGLIDNGLYGIYNILKYSNKEMFHLVEYEDLIANPEDEIAKIYSFLNIETFSHDFNNIENNIKEDDSIYGLIGQHDVRSSITKRNIDKNKFLSNYIINKYSNLEFWRNSERTL